MKPRQKNVRQEIKNRSSKHQKETFKNIYSPVEKFLNKKRENGWGKLRQILNAINFFLPIRNPHKPRSFSANRNFRQLAFKIIIVDVESRIESLERFSKAIQNLFFVFEKLQSKICHRKIIMGERR